MGPSNGPGFNTSSYAARWKDVGPGRLVQIDFLWECAKFCLGFVVRKPLLIITLGTQELPRLKVVFNQAIRNKI